MKRRSYIANSAKNSKKKYKRPVIKPQLSLNNVVINYSSGNIRSSESKKPFRIQDLLCSQFGKMNIGNFRRWEGMGRSPLLVAAGAGLHQTVHSLLKQGIDVDVRDGKDESALHKAVKRGNLQCVRILLRWNSSVDLQNHLHLTALHYAVVGGRVDIVSLLLAHGANVNTASTGGSYLLKECMLRWTSVPLNQYADIIQRLLQNGCYEFDFDLRIDWGTPPFTVDAVGGPLHWAVRNGQEAILQLMLQNGCDINVEDDKGYPPALRSLGNGFPQILVLLRRNLIQRRLTGSYISANNSCFSPDCNDAKWELYHDFHQRCQEEVIFMRNFKVCDKVTFLDIIFDSTRRFAKFAWHARVLEFMNNPANMDKLHYYAGYVEQSYIKLCKTRALLEKAESLTIDGMGIQLPNLPMKKIVGYLDCDSLRNFVTAYE